MKHELAEVLESNLKREEHYRSPSGSPLLFENGRSSNSYAELFGIEDKEMFQKAFRTVTEGKGKELSKINSIASSALLSLLVFFPIYSRRAKLTLKLDDKEITFNKCFFEVQNKVIVKPSCVDVVLYSEEEKSLLYLESKLSEFKEKVSPKETYGKSYYNLYEKLKPVFEKICFTISGSCDTEVKVTSKEKAYIEGIKQTISHLIGLVKGPQKKVEDAYDSTEYEKAYKSASTLYYGTILFDPSSLGVENYAFTAYSELFENFVSNGDVLCSHIRDWAKNTKLSDNKKIIILPKVLTYQALPCAYISCLPEKVKSFYDLK